MNNTNEQARAVIASALEESMKERAARLEAELTAANEQITDLIAIVALQSATASRTPEYTPGQWLDVRTLDEMQAFYMARLPAIREAAKEHGYAIGMHGSARRDFDLMAMQWRAGASDKNALAHAIAIAACGITRAGDFQWEVKPNGRFAVSMPICWLDHGNPDFDKPSMGHIDLSVIVAAAAEAQLRTTAVGAGDLIDAAVRLEARGFFAPSSCADAEAAKDMTAMRNAIAKHRPAANGAGDLKGGAA